MKSRAERRKEAKENGTVFEPQYKTGEKTIPAYLKTDENGKAVKIPAETIVLGGKPKTYEEAYGVGYERFNNKFVTIKEVSKETSEENTTE